jgi:hypothetical protein
VEGGRDLDRRTCAESSMWYGMALHGTAVVVSM